MYTQNQTPPSAMPAYSDMQQSQSNHHYASPTHLTEPSQPNGYNGSKSIHSSPVHGTAANNMDNSRFHSNMENTIGVNRAAIVEDTQKQCDNPILRHILSNKNAKRSSPAYNQSPPAKRLCTQVSGLDSGAISPVRTEDSLDYFDDFAFDKHPISTKNGFEYTPTMPSRMTGENLNAASSVATSPLNPIVSSPITNCTPPQSPNGEHVNHMSNACDVSAGK